MKFTHLHVHSDASIKDGLGTVERLVFAASERGFSTLALTDHGSLANSVRFMIACEMYKIKPILGCEMYVSVGDVTGHFTVLANGNNGFQNLVTLNNLGHASTHRKPAITIDQLIEHNENLILLTGCVSSPLNNLPFDDAVKLGAQLKGVFGDRMFSEVMFIADTDSWSRPMKLAKALSLPMVLTNDVHFPYEKDIDVHPVLTQMKAGFTYNSKQLWLKTPSEIAPRAVQAGILKSEFLEMVTNAQVLGEIIEPVVLKKEPRLPRMMKSKENLREMTIKALESSPFRFNDTYIERVQYELKVIEDMGYSSYFLILNDIISFAKKSKVRVGPGRGSGAGSLVIFLLGITGIDPIKYNLSFERFLNPERKGMPDVDVDFESERRDAVLEYARKKWSAIPIATYSRYSHKILVHDLAKAYRVTREDEHDAAEMGPESKEFEHVCQTYTGFELAYNAISGQIRHKGKHAGGVIITSDSVPIERVGEAMAAAWVEGEHSELSYAGIVKFDLLGLSALSVLRRLEEKFGIHAPEPVDDGPEFEIFRKGDVAGIFQFSGSDGIRDLTIELGPNCFDDLVALNALYRPGALHVGSAQKYPQWKKTPREVPEIVADILAPTYGAIVYQEQVMAIYARVTGGSLGEADLARRIIVKSKERGPEWEIKFSALRDAFLAGASKCGLPYKDAIQIWTELAAHAGYSFNRAHSVAYAMVAWEMAWWKFHYPADFYSAILNVDVTMAQSYITDSAKSGILIRPPHVNISSVEYETDGKTIFLPFTSVKFLGMPGAQAILDARNSIGGKFESIEQFMAVVPKKALKARGRLGLLHLGGFESIPGEAQTLGLKPDDVTQTYSNIDAQRAFLGFVIPTKKMLDFFERTTHGKDQIAGIIESKKSKTSKFGPYVVYHLTPQGSFWSREMMDLKVGQAVVVRIKKNSGKALKVDIL